MAIQRKIMRQIYLLSWRHFVKTSRWKDVSANSMLYVQCAAEFHTNTHTQTGSVFIALHFLFHTK